MERHASRRHADDPFARFHHEHRVVLERLDGLERVRLLARPTRATEPELRETIAHLERQFGTHMAAEDEVLFPVVLASLPEARRVLAPLADEHRALRAMVAAVTASLARPRDRAREERLSVETRDLVDLLRIHIEKEETVVFPLAERVLRAQGVRELTRRLRPFLHPDPTAAPDALASRRPSKGTPS